MPGTEKLVSLLISSGMSFKLHLWDMVSGVQVGFISFYSSRNLWCDLLPSKAYISPVLSPRFFFRVMVLTLHLCLLWYIFPPLHLSCGACWHKPLFIFKGQTSAQGFIWHLLAAEDVGVQCCPIAGDASRAWMITLWCQPGREWVMDGDTAEGFRQPTPQWQQGNTDGCTKPEAGDWQVMGVSVSWKHTASSRDKFPYW